GTVKRGGAGQCSAPRARVAGAGDEKGRILGTPAFAAPEQLRGEALASRADLYAAGATLFYLLTGRAPFEAVRLDELINQALNDPPPDLGPNIPAALSAIIRRCLNKRRDDRPADYAALAAALAPFAPVDTQPAPLPSR